MDEFDLDNSNFKVVSDDFFDPCYDLSEWTVDNWYKQQALKLCAIDYFDEDCILIQDADVILLKDYAPFVDGGPNFITEDLWNDYHKVYADCVYDLIGFQRGINYSLVNEILPYLRKDWLELRLHLEKLHKKNWLEVFPNYRKFDNSKWFSEYELLGIWKTNHSGYHYFGGPSQPPIQCWEDVFSVDWSKHMLMKFNNQPLKFMTKPQAMELVSYLNEKNN